MKVAEILYEDCEVIYKDEEGNILTEAARRAFRRKGAKIIRGYRCTGGPKAGRVVTNPSVCSHRKDPAKVRRGRKTMRRKGAMIHRKGKLTRRRSISKLLVNINRRLSRLFKR